MLASLANTALSAPNNLNVSTADELNDESCVEIWHSNLGATLLAIGIKASEEIIIALTPISCR